MPTCVYSGLKRSLLLACLVYTLIFPDGSRGVVLSILIDFVVPDYSIPSRLFYELFGVPNICNCFGSFLIIIICALVGL